MNTQYFSKEDIENGTFEAFLKALIDFGRNSKTHFNDIHIKHMDCAALQLEWEEINIEYQREEGEFVFVDADHSVFREVIMPDGSSQYVWEEITDKEAIDEWLKQNPKWKKNSLGRWVEED